MTERSHIEWRALLDKYDALDATTWLAWTRLQDAQRADAPTAELLYSYEKAKALRIAAE